MRYVFALGFFFHTVAFAVPLTGTVYEMKSDHTKPLFQWARTEEGTPAAMKIKLVYTAPDGSVAVEENVRMENGKIKSYTIDEHQTNEKGALAVQGDKLLFSYTKGNETKTSEETLPENLILTATMADWLTDHSEALLKGETVEGRLGVLHRRETVGFKFFKDSEGSMDGKPTVTIKMKPTSFVIAAIVDPLYLTFEKSTFHLLQIRGRTMAKQQVDGKWKDLDADTIYHWGEATHSTASVPGGASRLTGHKGM